MFSDGLNKLKILLLTIIGHYYSNFLICVSGAHHIDLRASTADDPDWLVEQRATEIRLIKGWISDYYQKKKSVFSM